MICADYKGPWTKAGDAVQYQAFREGGALNLFFQPSNERSDWDHNLDFPVIPYRSAHPKWYAHRGFVKAWRSIEPIILPMILESTCVRIAGYSHGAALAVLAHEDAIFHGVKDCQTKVFGCPRVVWMPSQLVGWRWDGLVRYQVRGDPAGMVPPWCWGFRHVGTEYKLGPWCPPWPWRHAPARYLQYL